MKRRSIYDIFIGMLALMLFFMILCDILITLPKSVAITFYYIDKIVLGIFSIDYIGRFILSDDKIKFFNSNIIDLLSLLTIKLCIHTFDFIGIINEGNFLIIVALLKIMRLLVLIVKFGEKVKDKIKISRAVYILILTILIILIAALMIAFIEKISFSDALWWSFVTFTTVGYGDVMLQTGFAKFVAVILMIFGIGFISVTTSSVAIYIINGRNKMEDKISIKKKIIKEINLQIENIDELTYEDIENISKVLKALKDNEY